MTSARRKPRDADPDAERLAGGQAGMDRLRDAIRGVLAIPKAEMPKHTPKKRKGGRARHRKPPDPPRQVDGMMRVQDNSARP